MGTAFYACGLGLTAAAFLFSLVALRMKSFPAGPLGIAVVAVFVVLVGGTTTFAVGYAEEEQEHREHELKEAAAREEVEAAGEDEPGTGGNQTGPGSDTPEEVEQGSGTELDLGAEETELLFTKTTLQAKSGEVTINFDNPSSLPHNVAILDGSEELVVSDTVTQDETTATADLAPGDYTFVCTIPGHTETMQGILTVD